MSVSKSDLVVIVLAVLFVFVMVSPLSKHQGATVSTLSVDSLETEWYKRQLDSYPFNHSKIPTNDSNPTVQPPR
jgi:hypothetical protein